MPDRTRDPATDLDRDDLRPLGGVSRETPHSSYPPYWMHDENMRQGFGGMEHRAVARDEGASPYRSLPREPSERGRHYGRGPKGYRRSDARLLEDISDRLMANPDVDASDVVVHVANCVATLMGTVDNRYEKRIAEYIAEDVMGVDDVNNQLKVRHGFWASLTGDKASDQEIRRPAESEIPRPSAQAGRANAARNAAARRDRAK